MFSEAQTFALQRSRYARTLRQWAAAQAQRAARRALLRMADEQDRAVDVLLELSAERRDGETLH
jgi:hypothetical protein